MLLIGIPRPAATEAARGRDPGHLYRWRSGEAGREGQGIARGALGLTLQRLCCLQHLQRCTTADPRITASHPLLGADWGCYVEDGLFKTCMAHRTQPGWTGVGFLT